MYWLAKARVVISKTAKPWVNGSGVLLNVLSAIVKGSPVMILGFVSVPPMLRIWLPPTALQECPALGFRGG